MHPYFPLQDANDFREMFLSASIAIICPHTSEICEFFVNFVLRRAPHPLADLGAMAQRMATTGTP
jgi:hypothetical protein